MAHTYRALCKHFELVCERNRRRRGRAGLPFEDPIAGVKELIHVERAPGASTQQDIPAR